MSDAMTPEQIRLIRNTWRRIEPIGHRAARLFYAKLFDTDPSLRPLFKRNLDFQGQKLVIMIDAAIRGLEQPDALAPTLTRLGRRHAAYGVRPEHYDTVGRCLLWTLEQGLGPALNAEARAAWAELYQRLASQMLSAIGEPETDAA